MCLPQRNPPARLSGKPSAAVRWLCHAPVGMISPDGSCRDAEVDRLPSALRHDVRRLRRGLAVLAAILRIARVIAAADRHAAGLRHRGSTAGRSFDRAPGRYDGRAAGRAWRLRCARGDGRPCPASGPWFPHPVADCDRPGRSACADYHAGRRARHQCGARWRAARLGVRLGARRRIGSLCAGYAAGGSGARTRPDAAFGRGVAACGTAERGDRRRRLGPRCCREPCR